MTALGGQRIIPLATPADSAQADALADGLMLGGLPIVEVALRSDYALAALQRIAARRDIRVGAGTVLDVDQARAAIDAGAQFIVTPGLDATVVQCALDAGIEIVPGVMTPSEVQAARALGLRRVKLFPAGLLGGIEALDALGAVFRDVQFMPSAGVNQANLAEQLRHPSVFAVSGSWMTTTAILERGADAVATAAAAARSVAEA